MAIVLNMVCSGPPGKKECKVGRKRSSIRKSFKNTTTGKSVKLKKVTTSMDIPEEPKTGTHSNPNRMSGGQVNIPNKAQMKRKLSGY